MLTSSAVSPFRAVVRSLFWTGICVVVLFQVYVFADRQVEDLKTEYLDQSRKTLTNVVFTLSHSFQREIWATRKLQRLIRRIKRGKHPATRVPTLLIKAFPGISIAAFSGEGKQWFPADAPGKRLREGIWEFLLFTRSSPFAAETSPPFAVVKKRIKSMFGLINLPADFLGSLEGAGKYMDRGVPTLSWVLPESLFGPTSPGGAGGYWITLPLAHTPETEVARELITPAPEPTTGAYVVSGRASRPQILAKSGVSRLTRTAAEFLLHKGFECRDAKATLWRSAYIPGEAGLFVIAGISTKALFPWWVRHFQGGAVLTGLLLLLLFRGSGLLSGKRFGSNWSMAGKFSLLFLAVSLLPTLALIQFGLERVRENRSIAFGRNAQQIQTRLDEIDRSYRQFLEERKDLQKRLEVCLARHIAGNASDHTLRGFLASAAAVLGPLDALALTAGGSEVRFFSTTKVSIHNKDSEFRNFIKRYTGDLLIRNRKTPPASLMNAITLTSGDDLERFLTRADGSLDEIRPTRFGTVAMIRRYQFLRAPQDSRTMIGMISWTARSEEFSQPFIHRLFLKHAGVTPFAAAELSVVSPSMESLVKVFTVRPAARALPDPGFLAEDPELFWAGAADQLNGLLMASVAGAPPAEIPSRLEAGRREVEATLGLPPAEPIPGANTELQIVCQDAAGRMFPPHLGKVSHLRDLLNRVQTLGRNEATLLTLNREEHLAFALFPRFLSGGILAGLTPARAVFSDARFTQNLVWFSGLLSMLFLLSGAGFLTRLLLQRVRRLQGFLQDIERGDLDTRVPIGSSDELGQVEEAFNEMAGGLQKRERLKRFVSDQVWEETRKDDASALQVGGERREAAVLFSHLFAFDELTKRLSPEELTGLLNDYFTHMGRAVGARQGSIDKLIGDAVMAVFFPQEGLPHPAIRATEAAQEMLRATARMNAGKPDRGGISLRTDVGVHYGMVISGKIGSTAKAGRLDFTVIGDVVNTTARLVGVGAGRPRESVIVSSVVQEQLPTGMTVEKLPEMPLKGKAKSLEIYSVPL